MKLIVTVFEDTNIVASMEFEASTLAAFAKTGLDQFLSQPGRVITIRRAP